MSFTGPRVASSTTVSSRASLQFQLLVESETLEQRSKYELNRRVIGFWAPRGILGQRFRVGIGGYLDDG